MMRKGAETVLDLLAVLHSEWIALRSLRFPRGAVLAAMLLTAAFAAVVAASVSASIANGYDLVASAPAVAADAVTLGQLPVLAVAVTLITEEYPRASIRVSLRSVPRRGRLLLAKSSLAALLGLAAGVLLAGTGLVTARLLLGDADLGQPDEVVQVLLGSGGYLAAAAVVMVGIGTATRSTVLAILAGLLLLLAVPALAEVSSAAWLQTLGDGLPSTAGEVLRNPGDGGYGSVVAALVLLVWAAGSQLLAYTLLWARDA